ncbi:MAG TPA: hypothetical protein VFU05_16615 [Cyclobacteriaceae bacterium]|nr:hypothetical protein [Cyclobacteriaceae bacterium]
MKTNYMIAQNAQWKAPWRMPKADSSTKSTSTGSQLDSNSQSLLGRVVKGIQDFIKKIG